MPKSNSQKPIPFVNVKGGYASFIDEEVEARLFGDRYISEFRKMYSNDPIVGSIMLAMTKTFQSIEWKPHNDPKNALKRSLENINWIERLEEILMFLVYGHSVFEVVLQEEEDGVVTWKAMHSRPQDTISEWNKDSHGNLESITQCTTDGQTAKISAKKCLHFATNKSANNPRGKSILRNAYRDWYYKTNIEKIEAIGIERDLTGLPVLTPAEDAVLTDTDGRLTALGSWAWQVVRQIKRNEAEGLVIPFGWEFELQGSPGQRQFDLNNVIKRYDSKIAMSMLAQFLILGVTNDSGSFALAKEQSDLFHKAVEGFAKVVANTINQQFIGCRALSLLNGYEEVCYIEPVGANKLNLSDLASFMGRLFKFNVITPDDLLEEHVRKLASLPPRDPSTARIVQGVTDKIGQDTDQINGEDKKEPEKEIVDKDAVENKEA